MADVFVCVELPGQIPAALKATKRIGVADWKLLALTPHLEYALEKLGRTYNRPEDYHSEEEINQVGLADLDRLDTFCDMVDPMLQRQWALLAEHDIRPASLNWYHLKILFNCVSIRAFILRRVLEEERPNRVLYFGTREEPVTRELFFVRESVWSRIIPAVCSALNIQCETVGGYSDPSVLNRYPNTHDGGFAGDVKRLGRRMLGPSGARSLKNGIARASWARRRLLPSPARNGKAGTPYVLALESSYSLGLLLQEMEFRGDFNVLHWDKYRDSHGPQHLANVSVQNDGASSSEERSSQTLKERGKKLWSDIRSLPEFRQLLRFDSIDCFPAMERRLGHFFKTSVPEIAETYLQARSLLMASQPEFSLPYAVLAATMGDYDHQAVALAAKRENVPFIVYRHGSSSGHAMMESWPNKLHDHNELQPADYVLTFGQGDVEYLEKCDGPKASVIPIGSAALDRLKRPVPVAKTEGLRRSLGLSREKKTVLYVPTSMDGNVRVAPYRSRSPSRGFELERNIVDVFQEFQDYQFVVKLQSAPLYPCSPIALLVKDRRLGNTIVAIEPLTSLLPIADMFVTDYPSTTFLEMLTTDRPILVCGYQLPWPWAPGKWHPSVLEMWQERVAYAEGLEDFLELLRTYLREERFQPVRSKNTLLKLFGTHLDDGGSVDRACAFIESLAGGEMPAPLPAEAHIEGLRST